MKDFFQFRKLITPSVIKPLSWIGIVLCILSGLVLMVSSFGIYGSGGLTFLLGLCIIFLGPLLIRIISETILVIFAIYNKDYRIDEVGRDK